jgi:hypothetical protein
LEQPLKLNLGCGSDILSGWLNVDRHPAAGVDQVVDLDGLPWPWADSSVAEVRLKHVLEHLGRDTETFLGVIRELWRVCRDGTKVAIIVPHPRHDDFVSDPTHVRPITEGMLRLFDQSANLEGRRRGFSSTPLGLMTGVDFRIESVQLAIEPLWLERHQRGELSYDELKHAVQHYANVAREIDVVWRAVKPAGRP